MSPTSESDLPAVAHRPLVHHVRHAGVYPGWYSRVVQARVSVLVQARVSVLVHPVRPGSSREA